LEDRTVAGLDPAERAELHRLLEKVAVNFSREDVTCPQRKPNTVAAPVERTSGSA
jgi:MarR family transcriptional regulator, organic hydroperoxide resistance regulator